MKYNFFNNTIMLEFNSIFKQMYAGQLSLHCLSWNWETVSAAQTAFFKRC